MCVQCIYTPHACMYVCVSTYKADTDACTHVGMFLHYVCMYGGLKWGGIDRFVCIIYTYCECVYDVCMYMYHQRLIQNRTFLRLRLGDVFASSDSAGGVGKIVRFKVSLGVWRVSFGLRLCLCGSKTPNQLPPYWLFLMLP